MGLLNMRNALMSGKRTPTAKDYVQDGLVAMWDGIENAGWGIHDANATVWKDLIRDIDAAYSIASEIPNWGTDCWRSVSSGDGRIFRTIYPDLAGYDGHTVEIVASKNTAARGVIIGSYAYSDETGGSAGKNFEWYTSSSFRAFYDAHPDMVTNANEFPIGVRSYFATVKDGNEYKVIKGNGDVIGTGTGNVQLRGTHCSLGCDNRTGYMCLNGDICAIRIYSRALTAAEIAAKYAIDKARFGLP